MEYDLRPLLSLERPTSQELSEYYLGLLPEERAKVIREFLAEHPHAARQLDILRTFLAEVEPVAEPTSLLTQVQVFIAELIQSATRGGLQPALAGIRGGVEGVYQAGDIQIILTIDDDIDDPAKKVLSGLVVGAAPEQFRASLWRADEPTAVAETTPDDLGNFTISTLEPGLYELILSKEGQEIHIQAISAR